MAKLAAIVAALMAAEATKPLGEELSKALGAHAESEVTELGTLLTTSQAGLKDAAAQIETLAAQVKAYEPFKARAEALEGEKRTNVIRANFEAKAKEFGVQPNAIKTAMALVDISKLTVDIDKGTVEGLTKETFEALKPEHPTLFAPPPAPNIPAEKGNGGGDSSVKKFTQADVAAGKVKPEDVTSGKAIVEN